MGGNKFSDTGYRFRKNTFSRIDKWWPFAPATEEGFYDTVYYNTDTFDVSVEHKVIAKMFFRLNPDYKVSSRKVYQLYDWLGSIGGVSALMTSIFSLFFGGFIQFSTTTALITAMFGKNGYAKEIDASLAGDMGAEGGEQETSQPPASDASNKLVTLMQ